MENSYVGQTLKDDKNEEYVILSQVKYKNIPCAYAMKSSSDDEKGEKKFFQIIDDGNTHLVAIDSPKMIEALYDVMFKENIKEGKPRRIKDNESITDYFAYLDDFYKTKVNTIL